MSTGGATWAAAATLDIGGTNTFDISTTVAGPDQPYWSGYWVYTPTSDVTLTLDAQGTAGTSPDTVLEVLTGADPGTVLAYNDDFYGLLSGLSVNLHAGTAIHIRLGTFDASGNTVTILNLNATTVPWVPPLVDDYSIDIFYGGPKAPIAWDGGSEHLFESITNNARHYAGYTVEQQPPQSTVFGGFGYTTTTSSNADYVFHSGFVRPGLAVLPVYVDAEATNKYQLSIVRCVDDTITEVSRIAYPSQDFYTSGFIRTWIVFPGSTSILCHGNTGPGTPAVNAWSIDVASDGTLGSWVDLGAVAYPDPGSFPSGGAHYLGNISPPWVVSADVAFQQNTRAIYDRRTPNTIYDGYSLIPSPGGYATGDQFVTDPIGMPGHILTVARDNPTTAYWVTDNVLTSPAAGTYSVTQQVWAAPSGTTAAWAGYTKNGKVVAYVQDGTGAVRAFYDIFGTVIEFTNPAIVEVATQWGNVYVCPTVPRAGTPAVTSTYDAWITGTSDTSTSPMILEMFIQGPPPADPVYPCDQRIAEDLSTATFFGAPDGLYGDGVIYSPNDVTPDFFFSDYALDPDKPHRIEITFDPSSSHDRGSRRFWLTGVRENHEADDFATIGHGSGFANLYDGGTNTADSVSFLIGPNIAGWNDPTSGVAAGFNRIWFETDALGAVSEVAITKICTVVLPPPPPTPPTAPDKPQPEPPTPEPQARSGSPDVWASDVRISVPKPPNQRGLVSLGGGWAMSISGIVPDITETVHRRLSTPTFAPTNFGQQVTYDDTDLDEPPSDLVVF